MDLTARADLACSPERAFAEVASLDGYPAWLSIVLAVVAAPTAGGDPGPAWWVDVGARLGPFRRTKRLRMVRVEHQPPCRVRFERAEVDGRTHAPWVLSIDVEPRLDEEAAVVMRLHYGGSAALGWLDPILSSEIRRAGGRLAARLA
jgi:hypothetical protein